MSIEGKVTVPRKVDRLLIGQSESLQAHGLNINAPPPVEEDTPYRYRCLPRYKHDYFDTRRLSLSKQLRHQTQNVALDHTK